MKLVELGRTDQARWDDEILRLSIELIDEFNQFVRDLPPSTGDVEEDMRVRAEPFAQLARDIQAPSKSYR